MADDILGSADAVVEKKDEVSVQDQVKSALTELVGSGKKFETAEELAKGKLDSDTFINRLLDEQRDRDKTIQELQEQLNSTKTQGELDKLRNELSQRPTGEETKEVTPSQLSPEDLESMIEASVTKREAQASTKANLYQTNEALKSHFGDTEKATEAVRKRVEELGITVEDLTKMAGRSPKAALALVAGEQSAPSGDLSKRSSISAAAIVDGVSQTPTKETFDKLRRENPKQYYSPAVQQQIFKLHAEGKYL